MVSVDCKHGESKEFYELLRHFKYHKPTVNKTTNCKIRILNNVNQRYKKYFDTYKKLWYWRIKRKRWNFFDPKQFKMFGKKEQKSKLTEKVLREMKKPIYFEINEKEFGELPGDI